MKRTKLFGLMMALVVGMGFTSCSDDEDLSGDHIIIEPSANNPSTAYVGTPFVIKFTVALHDNRISEVDVRTGNLSIAGYPKTKFDDNKTNLLEFTYEPKESEVGELTFTIIAKDNKGADNFAQVKITIKEQPAEIESFTAVLLGSQASTTVGSFYATSTNEVFTVKEVAENADLVDFIYFFGNNNRAAIAAPADGDVQSVFDGIADWSVKNGTIFGLQSEMTATEFEAITESDEAILAATANTDLFLNRVALLSEGDIVAFVTEAGKKGIFMVSSIEGTTYGQESKITLEVKVQK